MEKKKRVSVTAHAVLLTTPGVVISSPTKPRLYLVAQASGHLFSIYIAS